MLQWVWEAASSAEMFDEVAFAIDDHETARLIDSFDGKYHMTSPECLSGTDRLIELQEKGRYREISGLIGRVMNPLSIKK